MLEDSEFELKENKIKTEYIYDETPTPCDIIKMFKDNLLRESLCRFCLCSHNLKNYDDPVSLNGEQMRLSNILECLEIKYEYLTSLNSFKICEECQQNITQFYMFTVKAKRIRQYFASFLSAIYNQNIHNYDHLNLNDNLFDYSNDCTFNDIDELISNIEIKYGNYDNNFSEFEIKQYTNDNMIKRKKTKKKSFDKTKNHVTKVLKKSLRIVTCYKCLVTFESRDSMLIHRKTCNKNMNLYFKCTHCLENVLKTDKSQHMSTLHPDKRVICNICNREFFFLCSLRYHILNSHKLESNVQCAVCNCTFANTYTAHEHYCKFKCTFCNRNCTHSKYLESYREQCERGLNEFQCTDCTFSYKYKFQLIRHVNSDHLGLPEEYFTRSTEKIDVKQQTKSIKYEKYLCTQCGKLLSSKASLNEHLIGHMGKTKCKKCNRMVNMATLDGHLKTHEPGFIRKKKKRKSKEKRKCEQCDYETFHKPQLEAHINKIHLNIRPYICNVCTKDFHSYAVFKEHQRIHNNDRLLCDICNKTFANRKCLTLHQRQHSGERPFLCEICNHAFISSFLRGVHMKSTHGNADVGCHICGKMFYLTNKLNRHIKHVHNGVKRKRYYKKNNSNNVDIH